MLLSCPDQHGLVAAVANFVVENDGNIVDADQHVDVADGQAVFFQRVEFELDGFGVDRDEIPPAFAPIAARYGMRVDVRFTDQLTPTAILASEKRGSRPTAAVSALTPDLGATDASGPLVLMMPERRASEATIEELLQTLKRHGGDTEVTVKLHSGSIAKVFDVPHPVRVTADLYGELKGLLGPQCLG